MNVVHKVTGYDKNTELLALEFDVSDEQLRRLQRYSYVDVPNKEALGSIELRDEASVEISSFCNLQVDKVGSYTWFIEPFAAA